MHNIRKETICVPHESIIIAKDKQLVFNIPKIIIEMIQVPVQHVE